MTAGRVDRARLHDDHEMLASFGRNESGGIDRASFSPADAEARAWLLGRCRDAGLVPREDGIGNLFLRLEPDGPPAVRQAPPVWAGSHLDAVPNGGRFDGAAGVLAAVEVLRCLREERVPLARPVEAVVWSDEEGCYQGLLGSSAMVDGLSSDDLDRMVGRDGRSLREALAASGRDPEAAVRTGATRGVADSYFELHIEQGVHLESTGADVGVVTRVVGLAHGRATFRGRADHAGTTPMDRRRDALRAAAAFILRLPQLPAETGRSEAVITCGDIDVAPGADNIVPRTAACRLDLRDVERSGLSTMADAVSSAARHCAAEHDTTAEVEWHHVADPTVMDADLADLVTRAADRLGYRHLALPSQAGHDAQRIASVAPAAMVFVPSKDGLSHSPDEYTDPEQLARGADVLLEAVAERAAAPAPRVRGTAHDTKETHGPA